MPKFYRYRLPNWLMRVVCVIENAILPILLYQLCRTLIFTTTLEIILLTFFIIIFVIFYLEII